MFATSKSRGISFQLKPLSMWLMVSGLLILMAAMAPGLRADDAPNPVFVQRAEKAFLAAKAKLAADTNNPTALWQLSRAAFDYADLQTTDARRADIAKQGIDAAHRLLAANPNSVEGHYYLAMDYAELAQTESIGALKLVRQMETEYAWVLKTNADFDHAGPDRNLGLLYRDAPGWPTSIGSRDKARQHLQRAAILTPDYPENFLNLIEAEIKWGEMAKARRDLKSLDELWPKAQKQYSGEAHEIDWADWTKRRDAAQKKADTAGKASTSPRNSAQ